MDKSELIRLKELAEKATPGPWVEFGLESGNGNSSYTVGIEKPGLDICRLDSQLYCKNCLCNAAYIAAANPQTVLALIDDLVKTKDALAHCRDKNSQLEKEADWLAEKASECAKGKCWEECPVSCEGKDAAQMFRDAARKAVD